MCSSVSWLGKLKCFHERKECVKVSQCKIKLSMYMWTFTLSVTLLKNQQRREDKEALFWWAIKQYFEVFSLSHFPNIVNDQVVIQKNRSQESSGWISIWLVNELEVEFSKWHCFSFCLFHPEQIMSMKPIGLSQEKKHLYINISQL